jgi:hypothetical protein
MEGFCIYNVSSKAAQKVMSASNVPEWDRQQFVSSPITTPITTPLKYQPTVQFETNSDAKKDVTMNGPKDVDVTMTDVTMKKDTMEPSK